MEVTNDGGAIEGAGTTRDGEDGVATVHLEGEGVGRASRIRAEVDGRRSTSRPCVGTRFAGGQRVDPA